MIDDQPEVTIDDPNFLYENNDGFQEVQSKKALKVKQKEREAEIRKQTVDVQQKKKEVVSKVKSTVITNLILLKISDMIFDKEKYEPFLSWGPDNKKY